MKKFVAIAASAALLSGMAQYSFAEKASKSKVDERLTDAGAVLNEIMAAPDKGIPQEILAGAHCVIVVPGFKKAAFVVGGEYGQGVGTCRTARGWSAPVMVQLAGGSFGFQIGAQSTDLVLLGMNQNSLQDMLKSKVKIGANASAAAGPVGRDAAAGTDWKLNSEFLTYSRSKGLFAGIDLSGSVLSQNTEDTRTEYGSDVPFEKVLNGGVPTPVSARPFVRTVAKYFVSAKKAQD